MTQGKRILFIAPTRIGDAVLSTAVLAHLLKTEPDALVTVVTSPLSAPLFEGYPQLGRIVRIVKRSYNRHWFDAWKQTVGTKWHAVWDMRNSILSRIVLAGERYIYTPQATAPKVKQYEAAFGLPQLPGPMLWPLAANIAAAEATLPAGTSYLIFAPIANWAPKEWPLAHYITLAKSLLTGIGAGWRPVIICAAHEAAKAKAMLDALAEFKPIDLTDGEADLLTIYACMQRSQGFIGNDSGLMHMASAAATPTIGLFGPTPNIGDDYPHVRFLYAEDKDLARLSPATVEKTFAQLVAA